MSHSTEIRDRHRALIEMRCKEAMTMPEIAHQLDITVGAAQNYVGDILRETGKRNMHAVCFAFGVELGAIQGRRNPS